MTTVSGANPASAASTPRTPEERERLYKLIYETQYPDAFRWDGLLPVARQGWRAHLDRLLTAFPQLWDSLPPDPAEQARKEAEEDGRMVEAWRCLPGHYAMAIYKTIELADRMTARAAAGYPVLIAPKGEK